MLVVLLILVYIVVTLIVVNRVGRKRTTLKDRIKRDIYRKDGYNGLGYDREGYDREGYNRAGWNREGYDREGYDRDGYDKDGFDREGYTREGVDRSGNVDETQKASLYNYLGYNIQGYDRHGRDAGGNDKSMYIPIISDLENKQRSAYKQLNDQQFRYAFIDIRIGYEIGMKALLAHKFNKEWYEKYYSNNTLDSNIHACQTFKLITKDFAERIYSAKNHCNEALHGSSEKNMAQAFFCYKVLCELIERVKISTGLNSEKPQ